MTKKDKSNQRYGPYGGAYMPEILVAPLKEVQDGWEYYWNDAAFRSELESILKHYAGRPTPMTEVCRYAEFINGPRIFLKREDLLHTGAHKINNALGQCLLAKKLGKKRIIAETGAGQHGLATATACAYMGLECVVYMGEVDIKRQEPNVLKMRLLGAEVVSVSQGSKTLKDAINEALRQWSATYDTSFYCLGSALGPYPYPQMVRGLHSIIGIETKQQILELTGSLPQFVIACIGGGSNAIGIFSAFLDDKKVELIGVEAGGKELGANEHAARFAGGSPGVLHGCYTYLLQDEVGQILPTASVSAGLDYPAIGPEHAMLYESGRVEYAYALDRDVIKAFKNLSQTEGIIPALESAHALAHLEQVAPDIPKGSVVIVNLSGRGDKDLPALFESKDFDLGDRS